MMIIDNKYNIGDIVFPRTDPDQAERLVIGIKVSPSGLLYECSCGAVSAWFYELEMDNEKVLT